MLTLLVLVLFLPGFYFLSQLLFCLLLILSFTAQFRHCRLELLDFDVFDFSILLWSQFLHGLYQFLLFSLDLDVVGSHVLILVLLKHLAQVLVKTLDTAVKGILSGQDLLPNLFCLVWSVVWAMCNLLLHHRHRRSTKNSSQVIQRSQKCGCGTYSRLAIIPETFFVVTVKPMLLSRDALGAFSPSSLFSNFFTASFTIHRQRNQWDWRETYIGQPFVVISSICLTVRVLLLCAKRFSMKDNYNLFLLILDL